MESFLKKIIDKNKKMDICLKRFYKSKKTVDFLEWQQLKTEKQILINNYPLPF